LAAPWRYKSVEHINYLLPIIEAELPIRFVIDGYGQTKSNENYWFRIACGRFKETVDFPIVRVEDRDTGRIRELTRAVIRRLQQRVQNGEV
jgi:hypothetical protein